MKKKKIEKTTQKRMFPKSIVKLIDDIDKKYGDLRYGKLFNELEQSLTHKE